MKEAKELLKQLTGRIGRPLKLMEVCGTHTVAIFRHGIRDLLPEGLSLISGPGCPVCVTSIRDVDSAMAIAAQKDVVLATFGDMLRVPGCDMALEGARAGGADVRVVYSPLDALEMARAEPQKQVVFFSTGFETTSPLVAATLSQAEAGGVENFFVYCTHKLVPPALRALLVAPDVQVDGFILPGHVCTVTGSRPYEYVATEFGKPSVITGFGAGDIVQGIAMLLSCIASNRPEVQIQYSSAVREEGNPRAMELLMKYFEPCDAHWRGIGTIPESGLRLREEFKRFDALERFTPEVADCPEPSGCSCGDVLRGVLTPDECPLFGAACTPESPIGACMVSTEGSCSAYFKYGGFSG